MEIKSILETSYDGMYKISSYDYPVFYIRKEYIFPIKIEEIFENFKIDESKSEILLDAGLSCAAEMKAIEYLARAEQSHFGLSQKLLKKGFKKNHIEKALSYLESKNFLSDERFSRAWLNTRKINHYEGKTKLVLELCSRGISKDIANSCVEEFFSENNEYEICKKAYKKFVKNGKTDDKLISSMLNAGFPYKMIKSVKDNED